VGKLAASVVLGGSEGARSALSAAKAFADAFSGFSKATAKIMGELDTLLAFYDFPRALGAPEDY
jgi:hypothetical protein